MDGKGFVSLRSNRNQNGNKNAIVLQCICAKMQKSSVVYPLICAESPYIPCLSTSGGVQTPRCCPDGLLTVKRGLSWGGLALLGGGSPCDVITIYERWTI